MVQRRTPSQDAGGRRPPDGARPSCRGAAAPAPSEQHVALAARSARPRIVIRIGPSTLIGKLDEQHTRRVAVQRIPRPNPVAKPPRRRGGGRSRAR